jgi:hypothetical protein
VTILKRDGWTQVTTQILLNRAKLHVADCPEHRNRLGLIDADALGGGGKPGLDRGHCGRAGELLDIALLRCGRWRLVAAQVVPNRLSRYPQLLGDRALAHAGLVHGDL